MNIGMNNNNNNKNEQTINFDVGLEVRIRNGEIDWEPIKQHIEREYREYVTEGERNGW
jgi:hypothetical protein